MSEFKDKYELVVGLEVHAQLLTQSKAFSTEPYVYGSPPNSQLSPVCLAHPGSLPMPNKEALKLALRMAIACECNIVEKSWYARKNYFYADLPKGYQITQYTKPLCTGGFIKVRDAEGNEKKIFLDKIILEEDSGKSIHDLDPYFTLIDLNRAGVPLIEIVSQPDIRTTEEAIQYLAEVRQLVRYLDICDGNMEEGSMRCDANISIRPIGSKDLNTRVEVKNINSIRNVGRAIEAEFARQAALVETGGKVTADTRGFDAVKGTTYPMRSKELANDYRYFPEPDIPPYIVKEEQIKAVADEMPMLPSVLKQKLVNEYQLSNYDAEVITAEKETALYYLDIAEASGKYKAVANWLLGPIRSYLNENAIEIDGIRLTKEEFCALVDLVESNKLSFSKASMEVLPRILKSVNAVNVEELVQQLNLLQTNDEDYIFKIVQEVVKAMPEKTAEYKGGKKGLLGLFMGEVMKKSGGKADPKMASRLLTQELEKN